MATAVGVLSARMRVEEKQMLQALAEAVEASDNQATVWPDSTPFQDRLPPPVR